jgi:hypothetical protein
MIGVGVMPLTTEFRHERVARNGIDQHVYRFPDGAELSVIKNPEPPGVLGWLYEAMYIGDDEPILRTHNAEDMNLFIEQEAAKHGGTTKPPKPGFYPSLRAPRKIKL